MRSSKTSRPVGSFRLFRVEAAPRSLAALASVALLLALASPAARAQEESPPFVMPTPEGWRTETIPFPLEFAPELPYTGLEELRFAPGMFEEGSEDFWSYAFVWWVGADEPNDLETMARFLEDYFRGLAHAVAESRGFEVGEASFEAALQAGEGRAFSGSAEAFDSFVTRSSLRLLISGEVLRCASESHQAIFFALSPQAGDHAVWTELAAVRAGFSC